MQAQLWKIRRLLMIKIANGFSFKNHVNQYHSDESKKSHVG